MQAIKDILSSLYSTVVLGNQKAIGAWVTTFVGSLGVQVEGVNVLEATGAQIISAVVTSAIVAAAVWVQPNKQ